MSFVIRTRIVYESENLKLFLYHLHSQIPPPLERHIPNAPNNHLERRPRFNAEFRVTRMEAKKEAKKGSAICLWHRMVWPQQDICTRLAIVYIYA